MPPTGELRTIPLAKIAVEEGFNPREQFERKELERLADSIRRHGVLVRLVPQKDDSEVPADGSQPSLPRGGRGAGDPGAR